MTRVIRSVSWKLHARRRSKTERERARTRARARASRSKLEGLCTYSGRNTVAKYSSCPCTPCRRSWCTATRGNSARPPGRAARCRSCSGVSRLCRTCRRARAPDGRTSSRLWRRRRRTSSSTRSRIPTRPNRRRCAAAGRRSARIPDFGTTAQRDRDRETSPRDSFGSRGENYYWGGGEGERQRERERSYHVLSAVRPRSGRMQHGGADAVHDAPQLRADLQSISVSRLRSRVRSIRFIHGCLDLPRTTENRRKLPSRRTAACTGARRCTWHRVVNPDRRNHCFAPARPPNNRPCLGWNSRGIHANILWSGFYVTSSSTLSKTRVKVG